MLTARWLERYVTGVCCLAALCLGGAGWQLARHPGPAPSALRAAAAGLFLLGIALRVDIRIGSHRLVNVWCDTAFVLALLWIPLPWVVPLTAVGKGAGLVLLRRPRVKLAYNAAVHVIAATAATAVVGALTVQPLQVRVARDLAVLLVAQAVYSLICNAWTVAVVAVANAASPAAIWRAGLGLQTLTMAGDLVVTATALALARLDPGLILLLPATALIPHQIYQGAMRGRVERESGRRLEEALSSLAELDEAAVLAHTAAAAADLVSADHAEVVRFGPTGGPAALTGPGGRAAGPVRYRSTAAVDLLEPAGGGRLGEIRVYFRQQVRLADRERTLLLTLAAAARNAVAAAQANAWPATTG